MTSEKCYTVDWFNDDGTFTAAFYTLDENGVEHLRARRTHKSRAAVMAWAKAMERQHERDLTAQG